MKFCYKEEVRIIIVHYLLSKFRLFNGLTNSNLIYPNGATLEKIVFQAYDKMVLKLVQQR